MVKSISLEDFKFELDGVGYFYKILKTMSNIQNINIDLTGFSFKDNGDVKDVMQGIQTASRLARSFSITITRSRHKCELSYLILSVSRLLGQLKRAESVEINFYWFPEGQKGSVFR